MKKLKELIMNFIQGFCMALADSVPGVSGGTIAFLLGFYDKFISSLDNLFRGNLEEKKSALIFLIKLGIGWIIGFGIAATILANLFNTQIYAMSSLFIGFIIFAIPLVIYEEKDSLKSNYKNIIFAILGIALVVAITLLTSSNGQTVDINNLNIGTIIYVFIAAAIAISAMVLPGISGSTLLLIFGLYIPIMTAVKEFFHFNFSYLPVLIILGLGIIAGIVFFVRLIRKCLENYRGQSIYAIIGMMIGSLYSIIQGPTTLSEPQAAMTFGTFNILFFILGILILVALQGLKIFMDKNKD
ncbi:MAG: DUF368 domain-containing protein [Clostridia bacterium]|nr:DUF368 domain-containing protein [Clostridia bacterium]